MAAEAQVTYSTESAFHALGLPDADELRLRADLMRRIGDIVATRRLTPVQASETIHMDPPFVAALLGGRRGEGALDGLLLALSNLGQDVELRITPAATGTGRLRVAA